MLFVFRRPNHRCWSFRAFRICRDDENTKGDELGYEVPLAQSA